MDNNNDPDPPSFADRMGFGGPEKVYKPDSFLPTQVKKRVCDLVVGHYNGLSGAEQRIVDVIKASVPSSEKLYDWSIGDKTSSDELMRPLLDCQWYELYTAVELFCADWDRTGSSRSWRFARDFNYLTDSHSIPWTIQGGWVIPSSDFEVTDDLEDLRATLNASVEPIAPHKELKRAVDALNVKDREPDCASAFTHASGAWKAAVGIASGHGTDWKKAFAWLEQSHPELNETMRLWSPTVNDGRHTEYDKIPDLATTRFIVNLCVGAVRMLSAHFTKSE